jgi:hypothetical protein
MSDEKISALVNYPTPLDVDLFAIVDTADVETKNITFAQLVAALQSEIFPGDYTLKNADADILVDFSGAGANADAALSFDESMNAFLTGILEVAALGFPGITDAIDYTDSFINLRAPVSLNNNSLEGVATLSNNNAGSPILLYDPLQLQTGTFINNEYGQLALDAFGIFYGAGNVPGISFEGLPISSLTISNGIVVGAS